MFESVTKMFKKSKNIQKMFKKYSYIKKPQEKKDTDEHLNFARVLEISSREIEMYEKTLAELQSTIK